MNIDLQQRQNFYRAGVLGLRALQDRGLGAQRFSPDGDARWKAFRGELTDSDRLDLLLRDGAAAHPVAFSAASVFALPDLAGDEPFGPEWTSLAVSAAGAALREVAAPMFSAEGPPSQILAAIARAWQLEPVGMAVSEVVPASRVVAAGAGAILALTDHMAGRPGMDFGDQVLLVTDLPAERQLFGLAAALCGSRSRPRTLGTAATPTDAQAIKFERATVVLSSADAQPAAREGAQRIGVAMGA